MRHTVTGAKEPCLDPAAVTKGCVDTLYLSRITEGRPYTSLYCRFGAQGTAPSFTHPSSAQRLHIFDSLNIGWSTQNDDWHTWIFVPPHGEGD